MCNNIFNIVIIIIIYYIRIGSDRSIKFIRLKEMGQGTTLPENFINSKETTII